MKNIESRIQRIENKLNMSEEPRVIEIVYFGEGELPPEHTEGGLTIRHVRYTDLPKEPLAKQGAECNGR